MPMNPKLHRQLLNAFGAVRIAKEGEAIGVSVRVDPFTGRRSMSVLGGGEDYKVCCPFCGDTRFRLEISHAWLVPTETGQKLGLSVVRCYNDGCDLNIDAPIERRRWCHERLQNMLKPYIARAHGIQIRQQASHGNVLKEMELPANRQPLYELPSNHPAMVYLRDERGFDPMKVAEEFELYYCIHDPNPSVTERIIIPIRIGGKLVGWQARMVGEPIDDEPKYYTAPGTAKSRILYNYDQAKDTSFGVVVSLSRPTTKRSPLAVSTIANNLSQQSTKSSMAWRIATVVPRNMVSIVCVQRAGAERSSRVKTFNVWVVASRLSGVKTAKTL